MTVELPPSLKISKKAYSAFPTNSSQITDESRKPIQLVDIDNLVEKFKFVPKNKAATPRNQSKALKTPTKELLNKNV